jgi:phosphate butyryltransferase
VSKLRDRTFYLGQVQRLFPCSRFPTGAPVTVAVAAADHAATLAAAAVASDLGIARFKLFGEERSIRDAAAEAGADTARFMLIPCANHEEAARQAAWAAASGEAQVLMKGAVHTSVFTKAFLDKAKGLVPPGGLISHIAAFLVPGYPKTLLLTDGGINISPDVEQKQTILLNAVTAAASLGIESPAAALIAPVEMVNPKIQSTVDAAELVSRHREKRIFGAAAVEGPMALDVALSEEAARIKGVAGKVPGAADILLMPGLDAGNAVYKAFAFQPGALAAGIIAGLSVPVVLTSRSDNEMTRFLSLCMALAAASGRA